MLALLHSNETPSLIEALQSSRNPLLRRRALVILDQFPGKALAASDVLPLLNAPDSALASTAARIVSKHKEWMVATTESFSSKLNGSTLPPAQLRLLEEAVKPWLAEPSVRALVSDLIESTDVERQRTAWRILAGAGATEAESRWLAPLQKALVEAEPPNLPLILEAASKVRAADLDRALQQVAGDVKRPLGLRLRALSASIRPGSSLPADSCGMLIGVLRDPSSMSARLEAARLFAKAKLSREQMLQLAAAMNSLGPLEFREALRAVRSASDAEVGGAFATALAKSPALNSYQESEIRTLFANLPAECFAIVQPALRELVAEDDARRRKLETLPAVVHAKGRAGEGRRIFENGKAACSACHRVGETGNLVGPNLSAIGKIRSTRDILESILFPSATIARDYEAQAIEMATGESVIGVISGNLPDAVVVTEATGDRRTLLRTQIASIQPITASLMPSGLEHALTEEELTDLVAYLQSCK